MKSGPIPHSAITEWIDVNDLHDEAIEFLACVRAMDRVFLDYQDTDPKDRRVVSSEPLTPALFKAMAGG